MSASLLVLVLPLIALIIVAGSVMIVALCRARRDDVPQVMSLSSLVLCWLASRQLPPSLPGRTTPVGTISLEDQEGGDVVGEAVATNDGEDG